MLQLIVRHGTVYALKMQQTTNIKGQLKKVRKELTTYSSCATNQAVICGESRKLVWTSLFGLNDMQDKLVGIIVNTPFDEIGEGKDTCLAFDTSLQDE